MVKEKSGVVIDLKRMDEQLDRLWSMQKVKEKWEIDPSKLIIKETVIGRGAFSTVHRGAYDGKNVAVKVLQYGTQKKDFMHEVSVWNKLDHPNVTKLIGATMGKGGTDCLLVVEYVPGGTLKSYLTKNRIKKLPLSDVIHFALDLARGLSYLHSQKIVHRDVKTDNLLLDENRSVKITDFGVSHFEASNYGEMTGNIGTFGYMAPEVLVGGPYDKKCDVYSFGICLWEIYCCAVPYSNVRCVEQSSTLVYKKLRPKIPRSCPKSVANVMKRCWDKDPSKRPEMDEVVRLLEAIDTSKARGMIQSHRFWGCCFVSLA